ncbi:MAG: class II aldolase/adducin family protein [Promethearchaeia archaeon]
MAKEKKIRNEIINAGKTLFEKGVVENNEGNISVRYGRKEELFITPTANNYQKCTPEEIVHMDFDGTALSKGKLPSTESKLHVDLYEARRKAKCVIHTHSRYATILSVVHKSIPIIMEEQIIYLGGSIDMAPYGEAHTENIGEAALQALGKKNAALLANHGVVVCGKSVANAVKAAELVEKLAQVYWGALQVGEPNIIPKDQTEKFEKMFNMLFRAK